MRRNGYLCTSGVNLDTAVRFAYRDFLFGCKISAIRRCFTLIFAFNISIVRHISTSGFCLTYWPRNYTTRFDHQVDNSHLVWSWYDHTLPSYSVFACWYVTWLCDLDFWPFDLEQLLCKAVTLPTLLPSLKTLRLWVLDLWVITFSVGYHWKCVRGHCACAVSRDPCVGGQKQLHFWYAGPRIAYSLCNFGGCTMKVIKVICKNNARPCVNRRMSFGACAKSRNLIKVP